MSIRYQPLLGFYPDALVRAGRVYPAAIARRPDSRWGRLLVDPAAPDPALRRLGAAHLAARLADDPTLTNGPTTCWQSDDRDGVRVTGGWYFDMIATCDALKTEYEDFAAAEPDDHGSISPARLPLRALAHELAVDPLTSGQGRDAAIGISVILTIPPELDDVAGPRSFVIGRRGHVSSDRGSWHVAPSGMLELTDDPDPVAATVATELEEELGIRIASAAVADRMVMLGLTQDLLRLKPDLVVRLDLSTAEVPAELAAVSEFSELAFVPADRHGLDTFWKEHVPQRLTPAAAGAIALFEESLPI